jgi:hypothetical protein
MRSTSQSRFAQLITGAALAEHRIGELERRLARGGGR